MQPQRLMVPSVVWLVYSVVRVRARARVRVGVRVGVRVRVSARAPNLVGILRGVRPHAARLDDETEAVLVDDVVPPLDWVGVKGWG